MGLGPYTDYKDSGVEWFSRLPASWSATKLKHISERLPGGTPDTSIDEYWRTDGSGTPWVSIGDMSGRQIISTTAKSLTKKAMAGKPLPIGKPGTLLFAMYASVGEVAPLGIHASWNQALLGIAPRATADPRFLYYALQSIRGWLPALYRSNTQNNLNADQVGNFDIPLPPLEIQKSISGYLDRETTQIDELIGKQERLIELLAEKRQATITHAVTKGLDPATPTKPSGIPWLGEVPIAWKVSRLKWTGASQESGTSVNGMDMPAGPGEIGVLKTGAVSKGYFIPEANKTVVLEDVHRVSCSVRKGTLIVNRANTPDLVGSIGRTTKDLPLLFLSDKLWQIDFEHADPNFIYWWSKTDAYRSQIQFRRVGASSSMQNLSYPDFLTVDIALPTADMQQKIAKYLDGRTAAIDLLSNKAVETIGLLQERRSALIFAAVTGKIDVRKEAS